MHKASSDNEKSDAAVSSHMMATIFCITFSVIVSAGMFLFWSIYGPAIQMHSYKQGYCDALEQTYHPSAETHSYCKGKSGGN